MGSMLGTLPGLQCTECPDNMHMTADLHCNGDSWIQVAPRGVSRQVHCTHKHTTLTTTLDSLTFDH